MQHFLLLTALVLTLFSCGNSTYYKSQETIIGIYCGQCEGNCFQGYAISGDSILKVSAKYHDQLKAGDRMKASKEEAKQVRDLLKLLPSNLDKYQGTIGCPDCHDQCGIYLSWNNSTGMKAIHIDPDKDKHPQELDAFVSAMSDLKLL
jgi:hypothetical protein